MTRARPFRSRTSRTSRIRRRRPLPPPCSFTGTALTSGSAPDVFPLLQRAANLTAAPGLPGATDVNQQIFIDAADPFNRVVITLCWKTSSDGAWRRHTLVTYVN